jgi:transposase
VTASPVVCSDETSARVSGKTWWEWVFVGTLAVLHVIRPSRRKAVVQALFGAVQPMVWVSDMLGSQRGHGVEWQVCLAHLLRDARYAVECGDIAFSAAFKRLLLRAIARPLAGFGAAPQPCLLHRSMVGVPDITHPQHQSREAGSWRA